MNFDNECHGLARGYLPDNWSVFPLAQLLLLPKPSSVISDVKVEYVVPDDWEINSLYHSVQKTAANIEELLFTPVAAGKYKAIEAPGLNLTLALLGDPSSGGSHYQHAETCRDVYAAIDSIWNMPKNDPYIIALTPLLGESSYEVFVKPAHYGCVASYGAEKLVHPQTLIYNVFRRFIIQSKLYDKVTNERDRWFLAGFLEYYSKKLTEKLFPLTIDENDLAIQDDYVSAITDGEFSVATESHTLTVSKSRMIHKSIAVIEQLDKRIQSITNDMESLDSFIRVLIECDSVPDIYQLLVERYGRDISNFFDSSVFGSDPLMYEWIEVSRSGGERPIDDKIATAVEDSIALIVTYNGESYLETCGCKVSELGGIARLATWLSYYRRDFEGPEFTLSIGNTFPRDETQIELDKKRYQELNLYLSIMKEIGFDCAVVAESELLFGPEIFLEQTGKINLPFISANVYKDGERVAPGYCTISKGSIEVTVIGLTPKLHWGLDRVWRARTSSLQFHSSVEAIGKALSEISKTQNNIIILGGRIKPALARLVADNYPEIQVIISYDNACYCTDEDGFIFHDYSGFYKNTLLLYPMLGNYGVSAFTLCLNENRKVVAYEEGHAFLSENYSDDPGVRSAIDSFYADEQRSYQDDKLPRQEIWSEKLDGGYSYVGAGSCRECHEEIYLDWALSKHAYSFKTLLRTHKHYQPGCAVCHVTGAGQRSGYKYGDIQSDKRNVQCEVCHGPGSHHIRDEKKESTVKKPPVSLCISCHNDERSRIRKEGYDKYYEKINHKTASR